MRLEEFDLLRRKLRFVRGESAGLNQDKQDRREQDDLQHATMCSDD